jgi:hypothetical protein
MAEKRKRQQKTEGTVHKVYQFLMAKRSPRTLLVGTLLAIGLLMGMVLGWGFISGTGVYWQQPLYDAGAHLSGWLFFKEDAWHFPIFDTIRMNSPDGTSIILTDSIPLVALVAKAIGLGLIDNLQYFGVFVFASYLLNGAALLWLLRQLGVSNVAGALFAFVLACFTTLYNVQFESFYAHFFVIFSFGFYFRLVRKFDRRDMGIFAGLVVASLLIHPYLFIMSAAIFGVTLATLLYRKSIELKAAELWAGVLVAAVGLVTFISGYMSHPPTGFQEKLYGKSASFALDPTALFNKWYTVDEIGTYVGWGFWLLLAVGLWLLWKTRATLTRKHFFLVGLCILFLLFAISNTFFVNGHQILHINLPGALSSLFEAFRASKRFILPLYYLLAVLAFVVAIRQRSRAILAVVMLALVVQVLDVSYFVKGVYASARQGQPTVLNEAEWKNAFTDVQKVEIFPSYSCLFDYRQTPLSGQWPASLELYQLAAKEGKASNSIRASRRTKDCGAEAKTAQSMPAKDSIFIYLADDNKKLIVDPAPECLANAKPFIYGMYCKGK